MTRRRFMELSSKKGRLRPRPRGPETYRIARARCNVAKCIPTSISGHGAILTRWRRMIRKSFDYGEWRMSTGMDGRGKAFESKWAHDAELRFKVEARRNRALGLWAAEKKGLSGDAAEDFVGGVIAADFQEAGDEDVFRKLRSELDASVSDA